MFLHEICLGCQVLQLGPLINQAQINAQAEIILFNEFKLKIKLTAMQN